MEELSHDIYEEVQIEQIDEWLLFNTNSTIFELYHGEKKDNFQCDDDEVCFILD
jgi:hypothetical protein